MNNATTPEPFVMQGGSTGLLALHGFTGAPAEMRPVGEYFANLGWTVRGPLLPGHGTDPTELNRLTWRDWLAGARHELARLEQECSTVFVAGLSMGAMLTCCLAHEHPIVAGMMLYSPALRVANPFIRFAGLLRHVMPFMPPDDPSKTDLTDPEALSRLWHYPAYPVGGASQLFKLQQHVRRILPEIKTPALIVASTQDATLHPRSAQTLHDLLGSSRKEIIVLDRSGHCLTVDVERDHVLAESERFVTKVASALAEDG